MCVCVFVRVCTRIRVLVQTHGDQLNMHALCYQCHTFRSQDIVSITPDYN